MYSASEREELPSSSAEYSELVRQVQELKLLSTPGMDTLDTVTGHSALLTPRSQEALIEPLLMESQQNEHEEESKKGAHDFAPPMDVNMDSTLFATSPLAHPSLEQMQQNEYEPEWGRGLITPRRQIPIQRREQQERPLWASTSSRPPSVLAEEESKSNADLPRKEMPYYSKRKPTDDGSQKDHPLQAEQRARDLDRPEKSYLTISPKTYSQENIEGVLDLLIADPETATLMRNKLKDSRLRAHGVSRRPASQQAKKRQKPTLISEEFRSTTAECQPMEVLSAMMRDGQKDQQKRRTNRAYLRMGEEPGLATQHLRHFAQNNAAGKPATVAAIQRMEQEEKEEEDDAESANYSVELDESSEDNSQDERYAEMATKEENEALDQLIVNRHHHFSERADPFVGTYAKEWSPPPAYPEAATAEAKMRQDVDRNNKKMRLYAKMREGEVVLEDLPWRIPHCRSRKSFRSL